ncbi:hypothetical protein FOMG_18848 [Fusarium oxysporum f. sp. melonis 26406]|uniref:Uncharacterized protein n=1 Tax=Fusarium oxysporum f. sp. melonis 26406 TaxID=1089452 RepID=W9Z728_FUSOX|nr:hypothetical protein FOMG_18848 [Fusarium oxysporum f. sp. melonis 26406]
MTTAQLHGAPTLTIKDLPSIWIISKTLNPFAGEAHAAKTSIPYPAPLRTIGQT